MDIQEYMENAIRASLADLLTKVDSTCLATLINASAELEFLKKKPLLSPVEVTKLYGIPTATLATWRSRAIGPDYIKAEGSVFYTPAQLERWITKNEVRIKTELNKRLVE